MGTEVGGVAGAVIEGYYFDKKVDKLSEAVEKVMASAHLKAKALMSDGFSGLTVQQIELFKHIDLSLDSIKNVYESEMHLTVDKVDKKAQATLASVDKIVHSWTRELLSPEMQRLAYEAKAVFNSLPIIDTRPKLTAFFPSFVAPSNQAFNILIKCIGNFPVLSNSKIKPTLVHNGKEYPSIHSQPEIAFSVPLHELFPLGGKAERGIRTASFDVTIPYEEKSSWSLLWPSQAFYHYQGSLYLLPESPGKITIYYTKKRKVEEKGTITSSQFTQNSRELAGGGAGHSVIDKPYFLRASPGWKIVPGTAEFHVDENKGRKQNSESLKNKWRLFEETPQEVTYLVTTHAYDPIEHCGKIRFRISVKVVRTHFVEETTKEEYRLKWGESIVIDESKGNWVIHFDSFDGLHNQIPGYGKSRFLRVESFSGKPVLSVDSPEQVSSHFLL